MPVYTIERELLGNNLVDQKRRAEPKVLETILGAVSDNGVVIKDFIGVGAMWLPLS